MDLIQLLSRHEGHDDMAGMDMGASANASASSADAGMDMDMGMGMSSCKSESRPASTAHYISFACLKSPFSSTLFGILLPIRTQARLGLYRPS